MNHLTDNFHCSSHQLMTIKLEESPSILGQSLLTLNIKWTLPQSRSVARVDPVVSLVTSQGCLTDCVSDCIAIEELEAYKDCVGFCGKTCTD